MPVPFNDDDARQLGQTAIDSGIDQGPWLICRRCSHVFSGPSRVGFAGLRVFTCADCNRSVIYPLTRGWRISWWILAIVTAVSGVWANATLHEGYSWVPAGLGIVSLVALCCDVGVRSRVDRATLAAIAGPPVDGTRDARGRVDAARAVGARPGYIAALTVVITFTVLASVLGALVVTGLNNAYSFTVVLQDDRAATTQPAYSGSVDLEQSSDPICGDGEDYHACVSMHVAMYNTA